MLCHGCRRTPEDIAALTRITERADREGWLVLLPRQPEGANAFGCWNWFDPNTSRGTAKPRSWPRRSSQCAASIARAANASGSSAFPPARALAAVLGLRHPRLVRGVLAHSGLACGAASTPATALTVMRHGPDNDVARIADDARAAEGDTAQPVALLVIQGDGDDVVAPINGVGLVDQFLRFNAHAAGRGGYRPAAALPPSDAMAHEAASASDTAHASTTGSPGAASIVRHVTVEGLGHAWSGGDADHAFADPLGPDALELLARFAADVALDIMAACERHTPRSRCPPPR